MKRILRASMGCLAVGLAASAFRLAKLPLSFVTLAAVFCLFCTVRLQNDWRDRFHDIKKGKIFATARPKLFLLLLLLFWAVCAALIGLIALQNATLALLLTVIALAALLYSETRKLPWVPICLSAIMSAIPAFLPSAFRTDVDRLLPLFVAAALLIFGREILKDLEDKSIDPGYKWTIPVAYGDYAAKWLGIASIAGACAAAATISPFVSAGILVACVGLVQFFRNAYPAKIMNWLDAGAALVIAALVTFPP